MQSVENKNDIAQDKHSGLTQLRAGNAPGLGIKPGTSEVNVVGGDINMFVRSQPQRNYFAGLKNSKSTLLLPQKKE